MAGVVTISQKTRNKIIRSVALGKPIKTVCEKYGVSYSMGVKIINQRVEYIMQGHDRNTGESYTSACCQAAVIMLYHPQAQENEVSSIKYCTACNSEAPNRNMFTLGDSELKQFFIRLNAHKTNNQ